MGAVLTSEERLMGTAVALPGGGFGVAMNGDRKKLKMPEGVFAEAIKESSSGGKKLVKKTPKGVSDLLHSHRATDVYIDLRDEIVAKCQIPKSQKKNIFRKYDNWDSQKICAVVKKYKPLFKEKGVQIHFNHHSLWYNFDDKMSMNVMHIRWLAFADASIDSKHCTQFAFDPLKIYDPPGLKPYWASGIYDYNKDNMKLLKDGKTHFPPGSVKAVTIDDEIPVASTVVNTGKKDNVEAAPEAILATSTKDTYLSFK